MRSDRFGATDLGRVAELGRGMFGGHGRRRTDVDASSGMMIDATTTLMTTELCSLGIEPNGCDGHVNVVADLVCFVRNEFGQR